MKLSYGRRWIAINMIIKKFAAVFLNCKRYSELPWFSENAQFAKIVHNSSAVRQILAKFTFSSV